MAGIWLCRLFFDGFFWGGWELVLVGGMYHIVNVWTYFAMSIFIIKIVIRHTLFILIYNVSYK